MRTEITIPFAFDTAPMEKVIQQHGETEVMRIIEGMVREGVAKALPEKDTYTYGMRSNGTKEPVIDWRRYIDDKVHAWLDSHMEEIIDEAALLMAARGSRKKQWREILAEIKED